MTIKVTILGCGTSFAVPVIGCDCEVCTSGNPRNQRTRPSILVETGDLQILVDCGPDFHIQALRAGLRKLDAVLLTHSHVDHISGIDELRVFNFHMNKPVDLYCDTQVENDLLTRFPYLFQTGLYEEGDTRAFPWFNVHHLGNQPIDIGGFRVIPIPVLHGQFLIYGFRFGDFAYITDCKTLPETSIPLLDGVKALVLNALRYKPHAVHLNIEEAVALADSLGIETVFFTHMSHELEYETVNRELNGKYALAYDGQTFEID